MNRVNKKSEHEWSLYQIKAEVNNLLHRDRRYDGVPMLFAVKKREQRPDWMDEAVSFVEKNDDPSSAEGLVNESFTRTEAEQFLRWYENNFYEQPLSEIQKRQLFTDPEDEADGFLSFSFIPNSRGCGIYSFYKGGGYDLPYHVEGYYNVRDAYQVPF